MYYKIISIIGFAVMTCITTSSFARINIVSTIPDFGAIAKEIGQDKISVTSLVRPTQDPHFVDAKPSFAIALNRADLLLVTGMELEGGWLPPLIRNARNPAISPGASGYVDCSRFVEAKEIKAVNRAQGDIHPGGNPHYWIDPRNGVRIAEGLKRVFIALAPEHKSAFEKNAHHFISLLKEKMTVWERQLNATGSRNVVVYHDSWIYFLDWTGYKQVGTLEPKPGVPPSGSHIAELIRKTRQQNVTLLLQESFYPTNLSRLFSQKTGAKLKVLPTMVGARDTTNYIDLIDHIVKEIIK
jgi:zinc/manganese transport system substrate-binding protein